MASEHDNYPEGYPHPAVTVATGNRLVRTLRPQHVIIQFRDGEVHEFYPDNPPRYQGGLWLFDICNEEEQYFVDADEVDTLTTRDQGAS